MYAPMCRKFNVNIPGSVYIYFMLIEVMTY